MNPQQPVIPDPDRPIQDPGGPVGDPTDPDRPIEYDVDEELDPYDEAVAESFPASDPPAASEPGIPSRPPRKS